MSPFFDHLEFSPWLSLVLVLAGIEMLTPGFFAIWLGGAALITGLVVLVIASMSWEAKIILFAILAAVSVLSWYKIGRRVRIATDDATLNRRGDSLVGRSG